MRKVGIVMGSTSDLPTVEKAIAVLRNYGVQTEVRVLSAHRCPDEAREFAASARVSGFSVLIAAAGISISPRNMIGRPGYADRAFRKNEKPARSKNPFTGMLLDPAVITPVS